MITDQDKIDYLVSALGDQDLDQYETWIEYYKSNPLAPLLTYLEFKDTIYQRIDRMRLMDPTLYRSE